VADWVAVAAVKDLQRRKKSLVQAGGESIALFMVGDRIFALRDICIHEQRSLSKGALLRGRVVCPGHQWQFDLETGWVEEQGRCQPSYDVKVQDGTVYVVPVPRIRVPEAGPAALGSP
jgi:nitrite reductase/ring-hydroxylating ferredoxin subunit